MSAPRIVAIGGGHGLAMSLEAMRDLAGELTAVVSVADDGGSSGRLRRELGIMAPGDMRRCLAALTPPGLVRDALDHRFDEGALTGHPAGNLLLAALLENCDDPVVAMDAAVEMVGARGRILPASRSRVDLLADTGRGVVRGQVAVSRSRDIQRLHVSPADPPVPLEVQAAIGAADVILLGPGSLYTSVLAAALPGVRHAIDASDALVIYVANLGPEPGETDGYTLADHIEAVRAHGVQPDVVLADAGLDVDPAHRDLVVQRGLRLPDTLAHEPSLLAAGVSELVTGVRS
ncbi:MAG: uridine diphosphate-N-acetylglucosamine-binding protein YvcK [Acidimicrobiales bacterium]|nr:uridine diphosphate-N-acetylglucosamine-binding protein YvcK [Acidimicrobiales bacterium]